MFSIRRVTQFAALLIVFAIAGTSLAQTQLPHKELSDPYANQDVRSGATQAAPSDALKPGADTKIDQRDPGRSGADGKAANSQGLTTTENPHDEE